MSPAASPGPAEPAGSAPPVPVTIVTAAARSSRASLSPSELSDIIVRLIRSFAVFGGGGSSPRRALCTRRASRPADVPRYTDEPALLYVAGSPHGMHSGGILSRTRG